MKPSIPDFKQNLSQNANAAAYSKGRDLKKHMTIAENLLWQKLRNRKLNGLKFRRQHAIDFYIVDFYCHSLQLIIEVDGEIHQLPDKKLYDKERTEDLQGKGFTIIRFTNDEIIYNLPDVISRIETEIDSLGTPLLKERGPGVRS